MAFSTQVLKIKSILKTFKPQTSKEYKDPSTIRAEEFFDFYFKKYPEANPDLTRDNIRA